MLTHPTQPPSNAFDARRHVDAVAVDVVVLEVNVTEINADAKFDSAVFGNVGGHSVVHS